MKLLLDTHVLLWWLADMPQLLPDTKAAIENPNNTVIISAVSIWEIAIKRGVGKLDIPDDWYYSIASSIDRRTPISDRSYKRLNTLLMPLRNG